MVFYREITRFRVTERNMAGKRIFFNFDENVPLTSVFIFAKAMTCIAKQHRDKPVENVIY